MPYKKKPVKKFFWKKRYIIVEKSDSKLYFDAFIVIYFWIFTIYFTKLVTVTFFVRSTYRNRVEKLTTFSFKSTFKYFFSQTPSRRWIKLKLIYTIQSNILINNQTQAWCYNL